MSDESALLAAIFAYPDEDTPRLIYADWLEEHGQPERAEFIRLQITLTSEYTTADDNRHDKLEEEYRAVWTAHLPLDPRATRSPWEWRFVRGMPELFRCDAGDTSAIIVIG